MNFISPEEAKTLINRFILRGESEIVRLEDVSGRVLAVDVFSARPLPPFDRVTMDGIALNAQFLENGIFVVEKTVFAGQPQAILEHPEFAIEIMTGAPLPTGTDTVIRYEDLVELEVDGTRAFQLREKVRVFAGQNIHRKGSDAVAGTKILQAGTKIGAVETGLLASEGLLEIPVRPRLSVAVISTGDEVISPGIPVQSHQIYRSNSYALKTLLEQHGAVCTLFHIPDNRESAREILWQILLTFPVLVLSGGVSKGKLDFIPALLEEAGVKRAFHGVRQRPGKPFWFGTRTDGKVVFALPGNPVSVFFCATHYVIPWLRHSAGLPELRHETAQLAKDITFEPPLTWFLPVSLHAAGAETIAEPKPGNGSGDFLNLKSCDGFLELPEGKIQFKKGESFRCIRFRVP